MKSGRALMAQWAPLTQICHSAVREVQGGAGRCREAHEWLDTTRPFSLDVWTPTLASVKHFIVFCVSAQGAEPAAGMFIHLLTNTTSE